MSMHSHVVEPRPVTWMLRNAYTFKPVAEFFREGDARVVYQLLRFPPDYEIIETGKALADWNKRIAEAGGTEPSD